MSSSRRKDNNPFVFMEFSEGVGRVVIELFANVVPKTAENFRCLCTGERGKSAASGLGLWYGGSAIHRIVPGFVAQGGDIEHDDGSGGESIYGPDGFADESFALRHDREGLLSMANSGRDRNTSNFFITFDRCAHLDGKHVVFGRVVDPERFLRRLEKLGTRSGHPKKPVAVAACGAAERPAYSNRDQNRPGRLGPADRHHDRDRSRSRDRGRRRRDRSRSPERERRGAYRHPDADKLASGYALRPPPNDRVRRAPPPGPQGAASRLAPRAAADPNARCDVCKRRGSLCLC